MASLLERAYLPTGGIGLTAGVDYFGDVGQRQSVSLLRPPENVSPTAPSLVDAEYSAPDAGWRVNPSEPGFSGGYGETGGSGQTGTPQGAIDAFGLTGQAATALGLVAQDPGLVQFGSTLSQGASYANAAFNPSFNTIAPIAMSQLGVPAPTAGAVMGGYNNGVPGAVLGAVQGLSSTNPVTAGAVLGGYNNGVPGAVSGAVQGLAYTNPVTGLYSLAAPVLELPTPGQIANNAMTALQYDTNFMSPQTSALASQDAGMYGFGAQTTNVSTTPANSTAMSYGTNYGSEQNNALAAQEAGMSVDLGGYSPDAPGQEGFDGSPSTSSGGGGGGSSKIVCTAMNHAYGFGSFRQAIWLQYSSAHMTKAHEVGYHTLFLPLVDAAYKRTKWFSPLLRKALENIARHRTADLRAELRGTKRDQLGRAYRAVLEPLCYAVGRIKGAR